MERLRMFPDSVLRLRLSNWQRIEVQCGWRKPVTPAALPVLASVARPHLRKTAVLARLPQRTVTVRESRRGVVLRRWRVA